MFGNVNLGLKSGDTVEVRVARSPRRRRHNESSAILDVEQKVSSTFEPIVD